MNRVLLGILCGIGFGLIDASMVVFGKSPDKSMGILLQAFFSRFALGFWRRTFRCACTRRLPALWWDC